MEETEGKDSDFKQEFAEAAEILDRGEVDLNTEVTEGTETTEN